MAQRRIFEWLGIALLILALLSITLAGCLPAVSPARTSTALLTRPSTLDPSPTFPASSAYRSSPTRVSHSVIVPAPTVTPQLSATVGGTRQAVVRSAPSATATAMIQPFPTLSFVDGTPSTTVPTPVVPFDKPLHVTNILLLGNDVPWAQGGRTDSINIISIDRGTGRTKLLSIPRDLYVAIPGWRMDRINLALPHGHGAQYPGGGGALVKDTVLYNLGIPVDYYLRIGFDGFKEIIDGIGGVDIVVNCPVEDYRLREPDLDPLDESNWELFSLGPGVHHLDGELALWYVRSRRSSNDIDRGRRQQKVISAVLQRLRSGDAVLDLPQLWDSFANMFETDIGLAAAMELALMVDQIGPLEHHLLSGQALQSWRVPQTGEAVQLLIAENAQPLLASFMTTSDLRVAKRAPIKVVVETSDIIMYRQVAENLRWYGFDPEIHVRSERDPVQTTITLQASSAKGLLVPTLSAIFGKETAAVELVDLPEVDASSAPTYYVTLSRTHNPCLSYLQLSSP